MIYIYIIIYIHRCWLFHGILIQAPPDDLEMVVQQIRELIQQLLQQAEARQRFDAAGWWDKRTP